MPEDGRTRGMRRNAMIGGALALLLGAVVVLGFWVWAYSAAIASGIDRVLPGIVSIRVSAGIAAVDPHLGALVLPLLFALGGAAGGALATWTWQWERDLPEPGPRRTSVRGAF